MELYILDNNDLSTLSILECSSYEINLDNQFTDKSTFRVNKAAGQIKDNFLVVNGLYQQFLFKIDEVEATDKEEKFVNLVCSDISNIFNRKIVEQETELMNTRSIEYFLAHMIDINFINSNDSFLNKDYIEVTYNEHTQAKVQTNAENGIYNFHTFMENCREYQNVYTDFKIEDNKLKITISYKNDTPIAIDTTLDEVTHYNKVYEQDITAKVQVYIRENGEIRNYFLKTDRTITTNINDPNRASGAIEVISVETPDDALQEATNVFKGNTYKHLVEFSISKNSKLVDTSILYIGRPIVIKTPDGIYESIISGISLDDDNYVNFKTGNIRINFIDKLKQEKDNYGNKLDVTGGIIKGNLTTEGNQITKGTILSEKSVGDTGFEAKRTDTGVGVFFGIGLDGDIHGIYSRALNKWLVMAQRQDNTVLLNGDITGKWNGTENDIATSNNADTWIPVMNGNKMQHTTVQSIVSRGDTATPSSKGLMSSSDKNKLDNIQKLEACSLPSNAQWHKLCNVSLNQHEQGEFLYVQIFLGNGNNGGTNQNAYIDLVMQKAWSGSDNGRYGCNAILHQLNSPFTTANTKIKVISNNTLDYDIWIYANVSYCRPNYIVHGTSNAKVTKIATTQSTEPSYGTACNILYKEDKGISLYDNGTGSTGTITLSENSANFTYLEIFYGKNNNYTNARAYSSVKVYAPNGRKVDLLWGAVEGSNTNQIQFAVKTISGTQITHNNAGYLNFEGTAWNKSTNTNEIYIIKVVGYR